MNKYIKLFALAGAALLLGACQEDLGLGTGTITPGNEILFGANAYFENGEPQTRTEYGDIVGNQIEVLWVPGEDCMDIACPQAVGAADHQAEYMVSAEDATTAGSGDNTAADDKASVLVRKSPVGLQWSASRTHNFYAAYPSKNQIAARAVGKLAQEYIDELGMTVSYDQETNAETATLRGFIPVDQSPAAENIKGSASTGWEVKPDMTYAYMVANASHTYGAGATVSLLFKPQVTALEFEIVSSALTGTNPNATYPQFTILGVQLFSKNGQQMAGQFDYTYPLTESGTGTFTKVAANGYEKITQTFGDGLLVNEGKAVKVTFFMLPGETFNVGTSGDLGLTVIYRIGDNPQVKTATLNKEITPKKKYFFSNVKLPTITENVSGSSWFSALAPNTLLSQVSIPVAGNVFANYEYGVTDAYFVQQSKKIKDLWDMGVRGFEICTASAMKGKSASSYNSQADIYDLSLGSQKVLVAETDEYSSKTFNDAFYELVKLQRENVSEEPLVLLCTYMASGDGFNPCTYVSNLFSYLDAYIDSTSITTDDFVQINSSSTVGDLRGKIAIVIRPGDDQRWLYENTQFNKGGFLSSSTPLTDPFTTLGIESYNSSVGLTAKLPDIINSSWWNKVMMVADWGVSSYDRWDRRYGSDWATAATFDDLTPSARKQKTAAGTNLYQMEQFLYGTNRTSAEVGTNTGWAHSGNDEDNNFNYYGNTTPSQPKATTNTSASEFNFAHSLSSGGTAYVQEWMRVVPDAGIGPICVSSGSSWGSAWSIWAKWPGSLAEKKEAIKDLFNMSVRTRGGTASNALYINVLTGYYPDTEVIDGLKPFKTDISASRSVSDLANQGKGGNFKTLAEHLNKYVYDLLSASPSGDGASQEKLQQTGPWGLVIIDHIGTDGTDAVEGNSRKLVDLIMLNNFKFPLATKTQTTSTDEVIPGQGDGQQGGTSE